jgi:hypothetical protein
MKQQVESQQSVKPKKNKKEKKNKKNKKDKISKDGTEKGRKTKKPRNRTSKQALRKAAETEAMKAQRSEEAWKANEAVAAATATATKANETPNGNDGAARQSSPSGKNFKVRDLVRPPSAESGGVPEPDIKYLLHAQAPSRPLPEPRRILVIMDLNGTLLHRPNKRRPFHFVERPWAQNFIDYCLDNFYVAIWSSARPDNVEKMVHRLLTPEQVSKCLLVWGRNKFGLTAADYEDRVQCYKRLTRMWTDRSIIESYPEDSGRWDQTNTVLVDDSREKARSEPYNLLQIPDFVGLDSEPLHVLPQVHDYLNSLCHQSNVSAYIKENPFKLNPAYKLPN